MPPEVIARVFEPFFTTKGKEKGTGLGLSMVFGFVKQSGGHVQVYSEVGIGTTLRLYLPRAAEATAEERPQAMNVLPRGHETVLAVEDNPGLRLILVKQLQDLGYRVLQAENAKSAIEILNRDETIDLLFTDILLPGGVNGADLRARPRGCAPISRCCSRPGFRRRRSGRTAHCRRARPCSASRIARKTWRCGCARRWSPDRPLGSTGAPCSAAASHGISGARHRSAARPARRFPGMYSAVRSSSEARPSSIVTGIAPPDSSAAWKSANWPAKRSGLGREVGERRVDRRAHRRVAGWKLHGSEPGEYAAVLLSAVKFSKQKRRRGSRSPSRASPRASRASRPRPRLAAAQSSTSIALTRVAVARTPRRSAR